MNQELINDYVNNNYNIPELSEKFNISRSSVHWILEKNKIKTQYRLKKKRHRKYEVDESFFDIIDTEDKAYFLGLLYADGYNDEKHFAIAISLHHEDKEVLEKFRTALKSTRPLQYVIHDIYREKTGINACNQYRLCVNSITMSKRLKSLGCHQKKSLTLEFPTKEQIPDNLLVHFIRGYFDGDGSFSYYLVKSRNSWQAAMTIISTENFCIELSKILKVTVGVTTSINKRFKESNTSTRELRISGTQQVYKFLKWIYNEHSISMQRKWDKFLNFEQKLKEEKKI